MADLPTLERSWAAVVAMPDLLAPALVEWLPERRWFAAKGRPISDVSLRVVAPADAVPDVVLTVATVSFADGDDRHQYAVALQHTDHVADEPIAELRQGWVGDAMRTKRGASRIVQLALRDSTAERSVRLLGAEQSNTSVIIDDRMIAKLLRRLQPGLNPDVDVPRHLSRVGFAYAPGLVGHFDVELDGGVANAVVVHDAIDNSGDLWGRIADQPDQAESIAELLGRRTAQLHAALATVDRGEADEFWAEPFTLEAQGAELAAVRSSLEQTQRLLAGRSDALSGDPDTVMGRFARLTEQPIEASRIRVHGDLHLGQILWTGDDVAFIDFEGEPARPIPDRRRKRSGLVDVAGLLRSFDYAGRQAGRGEAWVAAANRQLLDAYLAAIRPPLVPANAADIELLLDLYILEKALYEIRYEIAHRPDWLELPLRAAEALVS